jgi:hypothetical protein
MCIESENDKYFEKTRDDLNDNYSMMEGVRLKLTKESIILRHAARSSGIQGKCPIT